MKILVTGGRGQLGRGLARRAEARGDEVIACGRDALDVTVPSRVAAAVREHAPEVVIHAAGFTHVDRAERERARAHAVNTVGAGNVARACADRGTPMIDVSTDHVFDGASDRPYREDDRVAPINAYGETKAGGEREVLALGGTVVRTSWLFGHGGPSFVHAIARLAAERAVLRVVADQHGCPTWVDHLAEALLRLAAAGPRGEILHVCGDEPTTRHAFARAVIDELRRHRPLACERVEPIATADHPAPARRPAYAALDTSRARARGLPIGSWREGLRRMLAAELGGGLGGAR